MYKNICIFAIDNKIEVDEDDFILNIRYPLFKCVTELLKKGVDTFWIYKESAFQKRLYWELKEVIGFAYPTVLFKVVGVDELEHIELVDILTKGMFNDVRALEESSVVISYYKDKNSSACAMVDLAKEDNKEIIDLMAKSEAQSLLDEEDRYYMSAFQRSDLVRRAFYEWKPLVFDN